MKVMVGQFKTESNANIPLKNDLSRYDIAFNNECIRKLKVGDIFEEEGVEMIPAIYADTGPSYVLTRETYDYIEKLSNNNRYYKNKYETAILNESIVGIHYTYLLAYYVGLVLSKKYDFDLHTYLSNLVTSTPELCQGAYRNIWSGLADDNSYEDVDDVIHGMEMLVCLMKKTSGKEMIFANAERKLYLNKLLSSYWNKVSSEVDNG